MLFTLRSSGELEVIFGLLVDGYYLIASRDERSEEVR